MVSGMKDLFPGDRLFLLDKNGAHAGQLTKLLRLVLNSSRFPSNSKTSINSSIKRVHSSLAVNFLKLLCNCRKIRNGVQT